MRKTAVSRLPIVGVMGSGTEPHTERAEQLGAWLAEQEAHLLTGGGSGVMESVSRAFSNVQNRAGVVIGVLPGTVNTKGYAAKIGYPNPYVEIPIATHLNRTGDQGMDPLSRNHINILSSTVIVALPGGSGTASEVQLALRYQRPLIAFLRDRSEIPELPAQTPVSHNFADIRDFVRSHIAPHA